MENTETSERFCIPVGLTVPVLSRPHSAELPGRNSPHSGREQTGGSTISGGGEESSESVGESPVLATKSAPNLLSVSDEEEGEEDEAVQEGEGTVSTPTYSEEDHTASSSLAPAGEQRRHSPLSSKSFSHRKDTPGKCLPIIRKHKKSFSVSGVKLFLEGDRKEHEVEEGGRLLGAVSAMSVGVEVDSRSRGSSVLSTSSKTGSSASDVGMEDEDDDDEEVEKLQTTPSAHLSKGLKVSPGETGEGDGRLSAVVTNIDDYSASSEDDDNLRARSSAHWEKCDSDTTPTNTLSLSTRRPGSCQRKARGKLSTEEVDLGKSDETADVALSDIDVRVSSLNSSNSASQLEQGMAGSRVSNGVPPGASTPPPPRRESCPGTQESHPVSFPRPSLSQAPPPLQSPSQTTRDIHATIKQLRELTQEERPDSPTFQYGHWSDDSEKESRKAGSWRKKNNSFTASGSSPNTRNTNSFTLHTPQSKVSRNASSASDSVIFNSSTPSNQDVDISSLDFVPSPTYPSSPGGSPRAQRANMESPHPPSPLFISKSPQSQLPLTRSGEEGKMEVSPLKNSIKVEKPVPMSPLEKRVSRSAENLLMEDVPARPVDLERSVVTEDVGRTPKQLRFQPLQEEAAQLHTAKGKKGKAEKSVEREASRRGGFSKLFRRDSKRSKPSKTDSSSSLDVVAVGSEEEAGKKYQVKHGKSRAPPPPTQETKINPPLPSPVTTKPRASTIHVDMNLPHSVSLDLGQPLSSIPASSPFSERSPVPLSPSTISEGPSPELTDLEKAETSSVSLSVDNHPELELSVDEEKNWYSTIDRRLRKTITKHEKARQGAIFDWIRTERHFLRSLLVMKLVFHDKLQAEVSEEVLDQLFPQLDQLIKISRSFSDELVERQRQSTIIHDISDILLNRFTSQQGQEVLDTFSGFVCLQPNALELYKDLLKRKPKFARFMNGLYLNRHCERRKLPDFYLLVAQRVAKYVEMMKKLVKETEIQGLDHLPRLRQSSMALADMVEAVDSAFYKYTNRKELEDIQSRLEVSVSHSRKGWTRKELKRLDLLAQDRSLLKKGEAVWQGHGKQLSE